MNANECMEEIQRKLASLTSSPLYAYRIQHSYTPVVGEGSLQASIMFVGEAPGEKEALSGVPFCGRSGALLNELLGHINLTRGDVYITNLVKDRPEDNRDPTQEEIALYGPFLDQQIEAIKPRVIVMLGRLSMKYIFSRYASHEVIQPISDMHGRSYTGRTSYGEVVLLPLYHPAAGLYNPGLRPVLYEDIERLVPFMQSS